MQKLEDSVFSITKTTNLSPAVFSFLQPTEDCTDKTPLGGILSDTKLGWLALGPKFCVVDLKTGLKVAAHTFGSALSSSKITVTCVVELPTPLTDNSKQLIISLQCEDVSGLICVLHINGSQLLRCIQTDVVITELAVCDGLSDGVLSCFDDLVIAGTKCGEVLAFDLNRTALIQALKDISQGLEDQVRLEVNPATITFLPLSAIDQIEPQRELALENDDHITIVLNETSLVDGQYIFRNPDNSVRMTAKRKHVRVSAIQYIPQLNSVAIGYNFGAFQLWNLETLELEFTSQVNVECLPVTHFGFQEPCDDPRAFCYLWVIFSVVERFDEEFPLAVMYSLTYHGKRMLSDTKVLYQDFSSATVRFQLELGILEDMQPMVGGRCIACHTYSINSTLAEDGEESMLNLCQLVWECWSDNANEPLQYGMLLFDIDQWYKDQMPATWRLESSAFMSTTFCPELSRARILHIRLQPDSVLPYNHATRLEEHFFPNSLQYSCVCLNTSEACVINTLGRQRTVLFSMDSIGPPALLNPTRLYNSCIACGLTPLNMQTVINPNQEEQRSFLLSVALEARLCRFLKRCAQQWATGSHAGVGCTLSFLVEWSWQRGMELKEAAHAACTGGADCAARRLLAHCTLQLAHLAALLDALLTSCCARTVPAALNDIEEKYKGISTVSLYLQVVQWFLRVGLLPERLETGEHLPYPRENLVHTYNNRRTKLRRLENRTTENESEPCSLLYIDQLIENEFGADRIRQMWIKGGSNTGLYPPPCLYSLLRLYLLPDIAEEHKHSLVLYLLVDYSMVYDEVRYEEVIRRLMQFPTMFGLSNTAIKATQAFWHLDHRDFDFALDQLQCLTGNTLSEWQHNVVLSSLLAQKKTQAALQYLHVRKPPPIQSIKNEDGKVNMNHSRVNDHDKLEDWQSCCNLYLARGLVFEALDVIKMCVQNVATVEEKSQILNFFYNACRKTGQLSKMLSLTLTSFEEEVFVKYLEDCNDSKTSDILVMYYLHHSRYLEAQQYNNKLKQNRPQRMKEMSTSAESLCSTTERENTRDTLVEVICSALPKITNTVAKCVLNEKDFEPRASVSKPLSVCVQARSPQNKFTYKSSFIQDTIENASETWINKPKMRKGLKRALNIEDIPFICTPKLTKTKSIYSPNQASGGTPPKRPKLNLTATPRTPKVPNEVKISVQLAELLEMPEIHSIDSKMYERSGTDTPHSILKNRRSELCRSAATSPVDSRYLGDSDDELLETASNHTHYSDSANKHLRFTIPTASEFGSTPSPISPTPMHSLPMDLAREIDSRSEDIDMDETNTMESTSKDIDPKDTIKCRKSYKDNVKARRSLLISATSSLSDDPNSSIESIADIPITLLNPRCSGRNSSPARGTLIDICQRSRPIMVDAIDIDKTDRSSERDSEIIAVPTTPQRRKPIKCLDKSAPLLSRNMSSSPSRSGSLSSLPAILELPALEKTSAPHSEKSLLTTSRLRSRSWTPEKVIKSTKVSPKLASIEELPKMTSITEVPSETSHQEKQIQPPSPSRRNLRSRCHTPEVQVVETTSYSTRSLRSRSKTPEKILSSIMEKPRSKKSLSRMVLESNTFAEVKLTETTDVEMKEVKTETVIECTPMKANKLPTLMDVTFSPIVDKSVLQSSAESSATEKEKDISLMHTKTLPMFTMNETCFEKSVLHSYQSSFGDASVAEKEQSMTPQTGNNNVDSPTIDIRHLPAFTTLNMTDFNKSVLGGYESSIAETTQNNETDLTKELHLKDNLANSSQLPDVSFLQNASSLLTSDSEIDIKGSSGETESTSKVQKEKEKIVEIEREINEIEGDMSDENNERHEPDDSSADEVDEEESDNDNSSESEEESDSLEDNSSEDKNEVILIDDTDNDSSSTSKNLQIDDQASSSNNSSEAVPSEHIKIDNEAITADTHKEVDPIHIDTDVKDNINNKTSYEQPQEPNKESTDQQVLKKELDFNQSNFSVMTDDYSVLESDKSDITLNYDKQKEEAVVTSKEAMETEDIQVKVDLVQEFVSVSSEENKSIMPARPKDIDVVDAVQSSSKNTKKNKNVKNANDETNVDSNDETNDKINDTDEMDVSMEESKPKRSRKRSSSVSATKPKTVGVEDSDAILTRKRAKSICSNQSIGIEDIDTTPVKKQDKTAAAKVKKTVTSKTSRELEKADDSVDVGDVVTPKRRSSRIKSKNDDSSSNILEVSVKKSVSKESDPVDNKPTSRKGRKGILVTKPELSVIKENAVEESVKNVKEDITNEYSSTRRLTRHQKSVLSTVRESPKAPPKSRRSSAASRASVVSDVSMEEDDASSVLSSVSDERIKSMNKADSEDPSDPEESMTRSLSSASSSSEATKPRKDPLVRAASESKTTPKASRILRRISEDFGGRNDSPVRGRRASFNRACELLVTPKGRRTSTDVKENEGKTPDTPARRGRKGSTASNISTSEAETSVKRDYKTAVLRRDVARSLTLNSDENDSTIENANTATTRPVGRAASESKTTPKAAKITRSISVEVGGRNDSPVRGRRASINRARDLLITPKSRRTSVDVEMSDEESPEKPAPRTRKGSTASSTSSSKAGTRSRKGSVSEDVKTTKKK